MPGSKVPKDVDEYIAAAPETARGKLMELRSIVRAAAPLAEEAVSYHMPYYMLRGRLVGFAAYKDHVSLFGALPKELERELKPFKTGRGSVQFPLDGQLPAQLITKIVRVHVKLNEARESAHRSGRGRAAKDSATRTSAGPTPRRKAAGPS